MSTVVLQIKPPQKEEMLLAYHQYETTNPNPHVAAFFKLPQVTITLYHSGKALFQGETAEQEACRWDPSLSASPSETDGQEFPLIGTDEVGNGSYFGGLYVVASFVTPKDHAFLHSLGVDDSKKLKDPHIRKIAPLLMERIPHKALPVSPKKYNQAIASGYNAVSIKVALHNQAIYLLLQTGVRPQKIVIDAFTSVKNYQQYVRKEAHPVAEQVTLIEKAEGKYLAVAVSSIIARYLFLTYLDDISQQLGMTIPSGAGANVDRVASQLLQRYGMVALEETAKLHFANTKKAQGLLK